MASEPQATLRKAKPGDYVAIATGADEYCYARFYRDRTIGVLPVLSRGLVTLHEVKDFEPSFFARLWVYDSDPTPAFVLGHRPFEDEVSACPPPQYYPPDQFDPDYRIHGFNQTLYYIKRTSNPEEVRGMEVYLKLQPGDLGACLAKKNAGWPWLEGARSA